MCPSGDIFTYTLPSGVVLGFDQALVNKIALQQAYINLAAQLMCLSNLTENVCAGSAVTLPLAVTGPSHSNHWSVVGGALPTGLTLNGGWHAGKTTTITGTPTAGGTYSFTIKALGSNGYGITRTYTMCVIEISPDPLPDGDIGIAYSQTLTAPACATPPLSWQVTAGALPDGLTLDEQTGVISGTPTVDGTFNFTITLQTEAT